ncbi:MAG: hypothetical protein NZM04_04000 [Methylacidiphilales bacterium]|nr:hypothetical protein [Candidatus Methylacidiphilales bacterium]
MAKTLMAYKVTTYSFLSARFDSLPRTAITAAAGGTAAMLGGGNFANGALSAAFTYLFNDWIEIIFNNIIGQGPNSPIYGGKAYWKSDNGETLYEWDVTTGGYRSTDSKVPPGGNTRIPEGEWYAKIKIGGKPFKVHGVKFKYELSTNMKLHPPRSDILLHPDTGKLGTEGCVGFCGDRFQLKTFRYIMNDYLKYIEPRIRVKVNYAIKD